LRDYAKSSRFSPPAAGRAALRPIDRLSKHRQHHRGAAADRRNTRVLIPSPIRRPQQWQQHAPSEYPKASHRDCIGGPGGYFHGMIGKAKAGPLHLDRAIWRLRQGAGIAVTAATA